MTVATMVNVLGSLTECAADRVSRFTTAGLPFDPAPQIGLSPYSEPLIGDCGVWVQGYVENIYPTSNFPFQGETEPPCDVPMLAMEASILYAECGPQMDNQGDIPPAETYAAAGRMAEVGQAMWDGVRCCANDLDDFWSFMYRSLIPMDSEQGLFMGWTLSFTLGYVNRCLDCG